MASIVTLPPPKPDNPLHRAILNMMENETRKIIDEEALAASTRVIERVRGMAGEIATKVASLVYFEMRQEELRITVSLPEKEPKR